MSPLSIKDYPFHMSFYVKYCNFLFHAVMGFLKLILLLYLHLFNISLDNFEAKVKICTLLCFSQKNLTYVHFVKCITFYEST